LAVIIAIVISKPLEIKIFEKKINTVLLEKNAMALANKKEVYVFKSDLDKNKNILLKEEIRRKEVNTLYETYITEAEGTAGTKSSKGRL
jgi:hypothetical protein